MSRSNRRKTGKNKGRKGQNGGRSVSKIIVSGPLGMELSLPVSRLPFRLGSDTSLGAGKSIYPVIHGLSVPITQIIRTSAAGVFSTSDAINAQVLCSDWANRWQAVFDEYCMTGFSFEIRVVPVSGGSKGLVLVYLDERDSAAPSAAAAASSPRLDILPHASAMPILHRLDWIARDISDLTWTSTATATNPVYLKLYANPSNTGTASDGIIDIYITGTMNLDFRGFKN